MQKSIVKILVYRIPKKRNFHKIFLCEYYGDSMLNTDRLCLGCMNDNGGEKICAICGYDSDTRNDADCLPAKMWLKDRYLVGRVVDRDADGIVYIGWDNARDSIVNIREYFPSSSAMRNPDKTVWASEENKYAFNGGLMRFIEINEKLMESELPSLIPTTDTFEENGTAYAINATFSGITLEDFLSRNGGSLKWEQARPLFLPLMDTVKGIHEMGIVHGGICPKTILVGRDGKLRISSVKINPVVNDGFSSIEQYENSDGGIDASADVYAISATLFCVLIGNVPPAATARLENDNMAIPAKFAQELPRNVLVALANGLQVQSDKRTQTLNDFRNELVYGDSADGTDINAVAHRKAVKTETDGKAKKKNGSGVKYAAISAVCTAVVFLALAAVLSFTVFKDYIFPEDNSSVVVSDEPAPPSSQVIGTTDEGAEVAPKQYAVPDLSGKYYSEILEEADGEYENFKISIKGKEFSDKYARGTVCAQSLKAGTSVLKDAEIQVTISLGPKEIKIANVLGLNENEAKLELLKQGFLYENIKVVDKYDSESPSGVVLEQQPAYGTKVGTDVLVEIYINRYVEEEPQEENPNHLW